ncbi:MAG: ABC transporter substrate-binding protein [Burkholderiales bacterium]|nr:ABC transporter substrate-binding protein [Burkholderiales bacterium]
MEMTGWPVLFLLLVSASVRADPVVFQSTDTPPFWSASMPEDGDAGRLLHIVSAAAGVRYSIEYLPVKRFRMSRATYILGTPEVLDAPGHRAIFPIAFFRSAFFYYKPHHEAIELGNPASFRGHTLGVLRGTVEDRESFERNGIRVEESDSIDSLLRKLERGRIDFSILVKASGLYDIGRLFPEKADRFAVVEIPGTVRPIAIMIDTSSPEGREVAARYGKVLEQTIHGAAYRQALSNMYGRKRLEEAGREIDDFVKAYRNTWENDR